MSMTAVMRYGVWVPHGARFTIERAQLTLGSVEAAIPPHSIAARSRLIILAQLSPQNGKCADINHLTIIMHVSVHVGAVTLAASRSRFNYHAEDREARQTKAGTT